MGFIKLTLDDDVIIVATIFGLGLIVLGITLITMAITQIRIVSNQKNMYMWDKRMQLYVNLLEINNLVYQDIAQAKNLLFLALHQSPILFDTVTTETLKYINDNIESSIELIPTLIEYISERGYLTMGGKSKPQKKIDEIKNKIEFIITGNSAKTINSSVNYIDYF